VTLQLFERLLVEAGEAERLFTALAVVGLMSYAPALMQQALHTSVLGSAAVLAAWSATSMVVALAASSLPARLPARMRLLIGLPRFSRADEARSARLGDQEEPPRDRQACATEKTNPIVRPAARASWCQSGDRSGFGGRLRS
jgi:hypothetical protein